MAGALIAAPATSETLTVSSWGGVYQDAQRALYFTPFAEAFGVTVLEDEFGGGVGVLRAQVMSGTPTWNVVQVEAEELTLGCEEGLFVPIDYDLLDFGPEDFIPGAATECGVGTIVWSKVLTYDANRVDIAPESWADFWDTDTWPGTRGLRRGAQYNLEFALMADGVAPDAVYDVLRTPEGVDRAFAKLDELRDSVIWWQAGAQPLQMLAAGEVVMSTVYNGRVTASNRTGGTDFRVVWPGSIYAIDSWVIVEGTPNVDTAHAFINYTIAPERQAQMPEFIAYGTTVTAASDFVPEEFAADLPTTPGNIEQAIEFDTEFWVENIESLTERFDRWAAR
ncbi:spermidine/putrescine ABC transporter substrate-binding protein [Rhodobaculum claviforme]|uniref:Spermidine/putrescine ABC transporter substrate-binding protein n=2 Tax=Rhodobaculum claviforme TaxID=1549854 RepID=A0A934WIE6_9RHOB|nr:spermidine/putrescine ABC transporter substrate-binding protein [Rhodobaculum claviforme]